MTGNCRVPGVIVALVCVVALTGSMPVSAQDATKVIGDLTPSRPSLRSNAATIKDLQRRLDQRDAVIRNLLQRVQRLEREQAARTSARIVPAAIGPPARIPARTGVRRVATESVRTAGPSVAQNTDQPQTRSPDPPREKSTENAAPKPAPGTFEVSEEAAQRALERALVQSGASLLEPGKLEFIPSVTYQLQEKARPSQVALASDGTVLITENVNRTTQIESRALLRAGLPWDLQLEGSVPYNYKRFSNTTRVLGSGLGENDTDLVGFGDPSITVTKQINREGAVWPGLFVSGTWDSDFGQIKQNVPMGTGFNEFSAGITAVKRQDPLVFTTGFAYRTALENNDVQPGDQYTASVGVLLAASPQTSLRFTQQASFTSETSFRGRFVPGSDQTSALFSFGLVSILGRGLVMDFNASIGETPDAPDLAIRLAFPIRLN